MHLSMTSVVPVVVASVELVEQFQTERGTCISDAYMYADLMLTKSAQPAKDVKCELN